MKKILVTLFILTLVILFTEVGFILYDTKSSEKIIYKGIQIEKVDVGGMTKDEAKKVLDERFNKKLLNEKIEIIYKDKKIILDYKNLEVHYDVDKSVDEALNFGKKGNIITKTLAKWKMKDNIHDIKLNLIWNKTAVEKEVKKLAEGINIQPVDAKISYNGSTFSVTGDKSGQAVNEKKLVEIINSAISSNENEIPIDIPIEVLKARINREMLMNIKINISSFTTSFNKKNINRTENLRIAANFINGTLVLPGEIFSMNKALGPRLESKGYKEAPVIINGTLTSGLAGGICQVTTTVYNAEILANFKIVERRPHGILVSYVEAGRDATISGNTIDLKFKNTNKYPIYINTVMDKSTLTVNFFGAEEHPDQKIEISTEIYETIPADVEYIYDEELRENVKKVEQKPINGAKSRTYRKVYVNGELISSELLSRDTYKITKGRIRIGTKKVNSNNSTKK